MTFIAENKSNHPNQSLTHLTGFDKMLKNEKKPIAFLNRIYFNTKFL